MSGFVAVLLREGLRFSPEHLTEINENMQKNTQHSVHHQGDVHDEHISITTCVHEQENNQQPFLFSDDRYTLVFNGRLYNVDQLREQLGKKGYVFESDLDNEVVATLFLEKGVEMFAELRGMFSMLIWDSDQKVIYGARDSFGIKPFYVMENEAETVFASRKKFITYSNEQEKINKQALQNYLTYQYVPEPMTLTDGIYKVKPGHYFSKKMGEPIQFHRYFHAKFKPVRTERSQMMHKIRETLIDAVKVHMDHEQPIGSFLSGGVDSSLIAAIAKEVNPGIKTFSVGFANDDYSEIEAAKRAADQLQVENISYIVTPEEYIEKIPEIIWHMGDPLADPSCVPLYFVAREAKKHVGAVLSGEGADELFGGYNIYREPESLKLFKVLPDRINNILYRLAIVFPEGMKGKSFLKRGTTPLEDRYIGNAKMFDEQEKQQLLKSYDINMPYQLITEDLYRNVEKAHDVHKMQYIDINTWLPGDILLKAEKMTQAHSLELRVPFLDKEVFQIAQQVPVYEKIGKGETKLILRETFKGFLPNEILYRKKLGFPVPVKYWLKDELYSWARQLIINSPTDHIIDKVPVLQLLEKHRQNKGNYARKIWTILMFMVWHQIFIEKVYYFTNKVDYKINEGIS